jgi:putative hemolysin
VLSIALATYFSALSIALIGYSQSALEQHLAEHGKAHRGRWLDMHLQVASHSVALVRTTARISVFVFILVQVVGLGDDTRLDWTHLAIAGVISVGLIWTFTSIVASAVARYLEIELISGALPLMRLLAILFYPFTRSLAFVDEIVKRLAGANLLEEAEAEKELLRSIEDTQREGGLDPGAAAMLENIVEFTGTDVGEVMTPRTEIEGIEFADDLTAVRNAIIEIGHSRIPVYEENLDHIVGILYVKDLIPFLGADPAKFKLKPLLRKPIIVPETKAVSDLLKDFQRSEVHLAIVIDEYGGTAGLVTIEDVLEEIVGEIKDEHDTDEEEEPTLDRRSDTLAEVDGRFRIAEFNEALGLALPDEDEYDTVAGFLLAQFGRVPGVGDMTEAHGARFKVLVASPKHIERIAVELLEPVPVPPEGNGEEPSAK